MLTLKQSALVKACSELIYPSPCMTGFPQQNDIGALCLHAAIYATDARNRPDALHTNTIVSAGVGF